MKTILAAFAAIALAACGTPRPVCSDSYMCQNSSHITKRSGAPVSGFERSGDATATHGPSAPGKTGPSHGSKGSDKGGHGGSKGGKSGGHGKGGGEGHGGKGEGKSGNHGKGGHTAGNGKGKGGHK